VYKCLPPAGGKNFGTIFASSFAQNKIVSVFFARKKVVKTRVLFSKKGLTRRTSYACWYSSDK
jgi:hypothetical protein